MSELIRLHLTFRTPLAFEDGAVHGESLWALRVSPTTAKIDNIPFGTGELALGDLVEFDADHEIVRVLESGARTRLAAYDPGPAETPATARYRVVKDFLAEHDVLTEGAVPGVVALSVPNDLSDAQLAEICSRCPVALCLAESQEGHGDDGRPSARVTFSRDNLTG